MWFTCSISVKSLNTLKVNRRCSLVSGAQAVHEKRALSKWVLRCQKQVMFSRLLCWITFLMHLSSYHGSLYQAPTQDGTVRVSSNAVPRPKRQ